jgi:hypothetical protein
LDSQTLFYVGVAFFALSLILLAFWGSINTHPDALVRMSVLVGVLGLFMTLGSGIVAHMDATRTNPLTAGPPRAPTTTAQLEATSETAPRGPYPGVTSLPSQSPLKETGIPHMETVCEDLGRPADAWVPGQTGPHSDAGRILRASGQAYNWTCGGPDGPKITRDEITKSCQKHEWGKAAYTWDPHYAYSWFCI